LLLAQMDVPGEVSVGGGSGGSYSYNSNYSFSYDSSSGATFSHRESGKPASGVREAWTSEQADHAREEIDGLANDNAITADTAATLRADLRRIERLGR
jgi:hypothetical protein